MDWGRRGVNQPCLSLSIAEPGIYLHACVAGATLLSVNADEAAQSKSFANKATAYSVALILIWFTFAGTYCMVAMKFKQDTLLYGRSKAD